MNSNKAPEEASSEATTFLSKATRDSLFGGRLILWQPARGHGYRFNLDSVLLAGFVPKLRHVIDLGAGCGVLGLSLKYLGKIEQLTAVEIQPELVELARRNAAENGWQDACKFVTADLRQAQLPKADGVVFNPPYFASGQGRGSADFGRNLGRHEVTATLEDFIVSGLKHVQDNGPVCLIVRSERAIEAENIFKKHGAFLARRRDIMPRPNSAITHVLLEGRAGRNLGEFLALPPLVVHTECGREFSEEVKELLNL